MIENAAREPEVVDPGQLPQRAGANIQGAGIRYPWTIDGAERLHGGSYSVQPDRIETGTFPAGAATAADHLP